MTYKLTNRLIFQINLSLYLPYHIKMSPSPVIYKKNIQLLVPGQTDSDISNIQYGSTRLHPSLQL